MGLAKFSKGSLIRPGDNCHNGHPHSQGWSSCFHRKVFSLPNDCQPPSHGWSPIIPRMVTHHLKYVHPPSKRCSQSLVTHHRKLTKSAEALRISNHLWSLTLVTPSLPNLNQKQMQAEYTLHPQQQLAQASLSLAQLSPSFLTKAFWHTICLKEGKWK